MKLALLGIGAVVAACATWAAFAMPQSTKVAVGHSEPTQSVHRALADPDPGFAGTWHNTRMSEMELQVQGHKVTGRYRTTKGRPDSATWHDLVGFVGGDLISFTVLFRWTENDKENYSLASWSGQLVPGNNGEVIVTNWDVAVNVANDQEAENSWSALWAGSDEFSRGPAPRNK